jgi:hypothetical protein
MAEKEARHLIFQHDIESSDDGMFKSKDYILDSASELRNMSVQKCP